MRRTLNTLRRGVQIVPGCQEMARSVSSYSLYFSWSLPHMTVPTFLETLKKTRVLRKSFLLSAYHCSCLAWQIQNEAPLWSPSLHLKARTFEGSNSDKSNGGREEWDKGGPWGQRLQTQTHPRPDFPRVISHMALHLPRKL